MTTIDPILLAFVKAREGCETNLGNGTFAAYWDAAGEVWTIGYGTTGQGIIDGLVWTQAQCDAALEIKLVRAREELLALTPPSVIWPDGALDAITDFVYNEGSGNYAGSTVRKCVDINDWAGVKTHLLDWEYAGGVKLAGLVTRREDEAAMIQSTP